MATVLFFTPIMPGVTGQGAAIRAGMALEVLAEKYEVIVIHAGLWDANHEATDEGWVRSHAVAYYYVTAPISPEAAPRLIAEHLAHVDVAAVYVFRLAAAPLALLVMGLLGKGTLPNALDLDDDECTRTEKFIPLREAAGDFARAQHERAELNRLRGFQRMILMRFQVSLLASPEDRDSLASRYPDQKFAHLPNTMRVADEPALARSSDGGAARGNLLFLGTLDYLPNEDAMLYFCGEILPLLPAVSLRIVGVKPPDTVRRLSELAGVTVVGPVKEVAPEYARARMVVVPLRAGSGTRIKILEAFQFGVPVVSTSMGAAGLGVVNGVHLLIADTPPEFAAACKRLMTDDVLAATLVRDAHAWLRETHSAAQVRGTLHSLFAGV